MNNNLDTQAATFDPEDDNALVLAAKSGDEQAFGILVTRHRRKIYVAALRYTRVAEDAEDIVQQTFQKAFIHLRRFEGKSSFSTWLTRIAMNEAFMLLRKSRSQREILFDHMNENETTAAGAEMADSSPDPEAMYLEREGVDKLLAAMNTLTPCLRMAIELREFTELSLQETAIRMGLTVAAVKARVFRGRAKLRDSLRRFEQSPKGRRRLTTSCEANPRHFGYSLQLH